MALRILADQQRQLDVRQLREQVFEPKLCSFAPWRQVSTRALARIAVAHGNDGDARPIVERTPIDSHPGPQALAARVVPWHAGRVDAASRRLSHDENPRRFMRLQHGARTKRQMGLAGAASAHSDKQRVERRPCNARRARGDDGRTGSATGHGVRKSQTAVCDYRPAANTDVTT